MRSASRSSGKRPGLSRACPGAFVLLSLASAPAGAQSLQRFSINSVVSLDQFTGESAVARPQLIFDISATVRIGDRWQLYVRPWFREPRSSNWDVEIYQAEMRYERPGDISTRIELGYLASPIGLGMLDTSPSANPTIVPHMNYLIPMLPFDPGGPRQQAVASSYPFGALVTLSTNRWDARAAVVNAAPTRMLILGAPTKPRATPVFEGGAGVTPRAGLRLGVSFARGAYLTREEITAPASSDRHVTLLGIEGEYAFGSTKISGEAIRDAFATPSGTAIAHAWFVQATQTLSPRWFVAGRLEGTSAPVRGSGVFFASQPRLQVLEATAGYRVTPELTLRGGYFGRKFYGRTDWDRQVGASAVWAHRWW